MEQQTAVEWLFEQLWETPKDKLTWHTILKKAKEIEKQQIIDAFCVGEIQEGFEAEPELYYKETYENE
jgi:hypothetical protein